MVVGNLFVSTLTLAPSSGLGANILYGVTGNNSIFGGSGAGNYSTQDATCFGVGTCTSTSLGVSSIGMGFFAAAGTNGNETIAIGEQAMGQGSVTGSNNIVVDGQNTMANVNYSGSENNIAIGQGALRKFDSLWREYGYWMECS